MLIEFSVANYRSFRDEVTLSLVASPLKSGDGHQDDRNQFAAPADINLLTTTAIYGANASGKSNLFAAFAFMQRFVRSSHEHTDRIGGIGVEPFRLNARTETAPSFFEVVFIVDRQLFRYGFEVTREEVLSEWLHMEPGVGSDSLQDTEEVVLFERDGASISFHETFEKEGSLLFDRTRPNALFLSVSAQFNGKTALRLLDWFRSIKVTAGLLTLDEVMRLSTETLLGDEDSAIRVKKLIGKLDLGFEDISIERMKEFPPNLPALPEDASDQEGEIYSALEDMSKILVRVSDTVDTVPNAVHTFHRKVDHEGFPAGLERFNLDKHESEGTKKLFALSGLLVNTLEQGSILFVDELDARLHPLLTKQIVKLFNDPEENPRCAQLVFTTQDVNLLDHRLLRRDQIWFTEKDRQGASHLYSLVEFKIDNDGPFERDYIRGRYGAIPYLGGVRQMNLEQE